MSVARGQGSRCYADASTAAAIGLRCGFAPASVASGQRERVLIGRAGSSCRFATLGGTLNESDARSGNIAAGIGALINSTRQLGLVNDNTIYMGSEVPAGQALLKVGKELRK